MNEIRIALGFLELIAAFIVAFTVIFASIWKIFGGRIKSYISLIAEEQDKKRVNEIMKEIEKLMEQQQDIIRRLDKSEKDSMSHRGYSILRACKEGLEKGSMGALEFQQLSEMYKSYRDDKGNGAVEKIWKNFVKEVEIG